jgi:hypothetical protein
MTQSGIFIVRYRTGMTDAGMPMPALVFRMPMPTYGKVVQQSFTKFVNTGKKSSVPVQQ